MGNIRLKNISDVPLFQTAAKVHAQAFVIIRQMLQKQSHTLSEIDSEVENYLLKNDCTPAFKGYMSYPFSVCASVNDEVQHTFPDNRILTQGDIVSMDLGVRYKHVCVDAGETMYVGDKSTMPKDTNRLLDGTYACLKAGIEACKTARRIGDISESIEKTAKGYRLSPVQELCGHGTGYGVHEDPFVENCGRKRGTGPKIKPGLMIAIEPIMTLGDPDIMLMEDGWNLKTQDGSLAAQFEHNILFTQDGPQLITCWEA